MSYLLRTLGAFVFVAVFISSVRWLFKNTRKSPPLYVAHLVAYVGAVLLFAMRAADGP